MEGSGAGVDGDGVFRADVVGEGLFEGGDAGALGELSGVKGGGDGVDLVLFDDGVGEFDHVREGYRWQVAGVSREP